MSNLHIIPLNDLRTHDMTSMCSCKPRAEFANGSMLIIHNSFDGREGVELAQEILDRKTFWNRCCGRCNGHSDECVSEWVCKEHNESGCELCFGPRGDQEVKPDCKLYPGLNGCDHFFEIEK